MKKLTLQESFNLAGKPINIAADNYWPDDGCILDMDYFVKTLSGIKAKAVRPELIGSIISHYASKWLPELSGADIDKPPPTDLVEYPGSVSTSWMKKRFFIETLVGILPPEKDSVSCNFMLRLLRVANVVGVEPAYKAELENRISSQLEQASLKEIMIPSFNHTCGTLLDVELVLRLVKRFMDLDEAFKSAAAMIKVAKLVDHYLAEAAVDSNLTLPEFVELAGALPPYARSSDDGLYRAIDTFLKAHPGVTKQERKSLCTLMDVRKLTPEASLHAARNERLPVRAVLQILFSEQSKLNKQIDWTGSFSRPISPNSTQDPPTRCLSKREANAHSLEIKKLKEEIRRLQGHCGAMQGQIDRLVEKKKGVFNWRKIVFASFGGSRSGDIVEGGEGEKGQTPAVDLKRRIFGSKTPNRRRKSIS